MFTNQEKEKIIPTLMSSEYGHRLETFKDPPGRDHVRIAHVQTEFYSRTGINISNEMHWRSSCWLVTLRRLVSWVERRGYGGKFGGENCDSILWWPCANNFIRSPMVTCYWLIYRSRPAAIQANHSGDRCLIIAKWTHTMYNVHVPLKLPFTLLCGLKLQSISFLCHPKILAILFL